MLWFAHGTVVQRVNCNHNTGVVQHKRQSCFYFRVLQRAVKHVVL